jgi:peptidoglycan/xylan/chitin deacetylase (PgdA/CDA1 family)
MRGVRRIKRWQRRFRASAIILCYHRVTELDTDPQLLSVTPQHFREQLDVLRQHYHVARLQDWTSEQPNSARRTVIITFDDGYADNFHEALPLLQEANCPATVFITAGKIDDEGEFWWDELERVILAPENLPDELFVSIGGHKYDWDTGSRLDDKQTRNGWHVLLKQEPTPRQAAYLDLCRLLRKVDEVERSRVLDELCIWAGLERSGRSSHRPLTRSELRSLQASELIDIGGHTVTHPSLSSLSISAQELEVEKCKMMLESFIGRPVRSFSYPFGSVEDYNSDTLRLVQNAGFDCACANYPGLAHAKNLYELPRFLVRDWDGDYFAKTLESWLRVEWH